MNESAASYAAARQRNTSRIRATIANRCAAMRAAKARRQAERRADSPARWAPPDLRRIIVVIDLDSGTPRMRMMQLWRGDRIDRYRVRTPRGMSARSHGWSEILATLRARMPRVRESAN